VTGRSDALAPARLPAWLGRLASPALLVFGANMTRSGFAFVLGLVVARVLGPEDFGVLATFTAATIWAHNLVGEGFDPGVVRLYARRQAQDTQRAGDILGAALVLRLLLLLPMAALFWLLSSFANEEAVGHAIRLAALTAAAASLATLSLAVLQASERFFAYALLTPLVNALRLCSLPLLWLAGLLTLDALMWTHALFFALGAAVGMFLLRAPLRQCRADRATFVELVRFSRWTALASLCFLLQSYLALPALTQWSGLSQAGFYSAAATLLMFIDQLTVALLTTRLPSTSRISSTPELRRYVAAIAPKLLLAGGALGLLWPAAEWLVTQAYGHDYADAAPVMRWLLPGFIATLCSHPLYLVLYAQNRPHGYAVTGIASLLLWCALALWLIPAHGAVGAAMAGSAARIGQALLIAVLVWRALRHPSSPSNRTDP
jgi:O-antigen/teichoic acid export membrane protein